VNGSQAIQAAGRIGSFCARHLLALLVTVAVPCVLWTVAYFALLLWAVVTDGGLGGPLAYPGGLVFLFVAAMVASLVLFFPATALAEWLARRRAYPILAQIPFSVAVLAVLCLILSSIRGISVSFGALFAALLLPLGLYWWTAQSGPLLLSLFQRLRSILLPHD
jgi:hypothetical protein